MSEQELDESRVGFKLRDADRQDATKLAMILGRMVDVFHTESANPYSALELWGAGPGWAADRPPRGGPAA